MEQHTKNVLVAAKILRELDTLEKDFEAQLEALATDFDERIRSIRRRMSEIVPVATAPVDVIGRQVMQAPVVATPLAPVATARPPILPMKDTLSPQVQLPPLQQQQHTHCDLVASSPIIPQQVPATGVVPVIRGNFAERNEIVARRIKGGKGIVVPMSPRNIATVENQSYQEFDAEMAIDPLNG